MNHGPLIIGQEPRNEDIPLQAGQTESAGLRDYWRERMGRYAGLQATGTLPFDPDYQQWLYLLKEWAIRRALGAAGLDLAGRSVIDLGCGNGYFEPFFTSAGAAEVVGVDFVESAIDRLRRERPGYEYVAGEMGAGLPEQLGGRQFDLVAAIDVLYHIVDDTRFAAALEEMCALCRPAGGALLWTDAPGRDRAGRSGHCRYRSPAEYEPVLSAHGFRVAAVVPMYCLFDVEAGWSRWAARYPSVTYPVMFLLDRCLAGWGLRRTANRCYVAVSGQVPMTPEAGRGR